MSIVNDLYNYHAEASDAVMLTDFSELSLAAERILAAKDTGATIFTAGSSSSAPIASHLCSSLIDACRVQGRVGFRSVCLNDSTALVARIAGEACWEDVYAKELETLANPGDLLVVYNGSGNAEDILRAVKLAKRLGVFTVGFTGQNGGRLAGLADLTLRAPSDSPEMTEDFHLMYGHAMVAAIRKELAGRFDIEFTDRHYPAAPIRAALFDFDGTVSLIRAGWQEVMTPYFCEVLSATPKAEGAAAVKAVVTEFVDALTGKQTIFQCMKLDDEVVARGGAHMDPLEYKHEYLRRLKQHIAHRLHDLENGAAPGDYRVPGSVELICALKAAGVECYLASGTDEADVLHEAALLGVDRLFEGRIYGARDDMLDCSKELVIRELLEHNGLSGPELCAFGDGCVEIELVKKLGGYTFGAATDEEHRQGVNDWKRQRLTAAGADAILPDFSNVHRILEVLGLK